MRRTRSEHFARRALSRRGAIACAALPANEQPPTGGALGGSRAAAPSKSRLVGAGEATAKRAWRAEGRDSMRRCARKRAAALRRVLPRRAQRRCARPRCEWGGRGGGEARPKGEARRSFARHAQVSERLPSGAASLPSRAAGARNVRAYRQRVCRRNRGRMPRYRRGARRATPSDAPYPGPTRSARLMCVRAAVTSAPSAEERPCAGEFRLSPVPAAHLGSPCLHQGTESHHRRVLQ